MTRYEEVIEKSQENVRSLGKKLQSLEQLRQQIEGLIEQPKIFSDNYDQITAWSKDFTNTLGEATNKYLVDNNALFTTKLNELSAKTNDLESEISRLTNTDFPKLFQGLQIEFIDQTRQDLAIELSRFEEKSQELQLRVDGLKGQVNRLEEIDLEKHFDALQKTLADIFGAINNINLTLTSITQTLNGIVQSLGVIQDTIGKNHQEQLETIIKSRSTLESHLKKQDEQTEAYITKLENKVAEISEQNHILKMILQQTDLY